MVFMENACRPLLAVAFCLILVSASAVFAAVPANGAEDDIFAEPIQKPIYVTRIQYVLDDSADSGWNGLIFNAKYRVVNVTEIIVNDTLYRPFDADAEVIRNKPKGTEVWDSDDLYTMRMYDVSGLKECGSMAGSISDIYDCVVEFNRAHNATSTCRSSTSAFKIAFMQSRLGDVANGTEADYSLAKAFVREGNNGHRFIVLLNSNGYYVIDPYWGGGWGLKMAQAVKEFTRTFYDDAGSANHRSLVDRVEFFFGS